MGCSKTGPADSRIRSSVGFNILQGRLGHSVRRRKSPRFLGVKLSREGIRRLKFTFLSCAGMDIITPVPRWR
jgi:hypothetical protein